MTSPNSLFDGRSIDPGNQPQSSVTKQARRKQKVDSKLGQSEHKLASNNVLNPQDLKLRCLRCKKRKLNVRSPKLILELADKT
jgi:ribosomal protein L44E